MLWLYKIIEAQRPNSLVGKFLREAQMIIHKDIYNRIPKIKNNMEKCYECVGAKTKREGVYIKQCITWKVQD